MEKITYDDLVEYLKDNANLLQEIVNEVNSWNGDLEDYIWYENNEYFYDDYFSSKEEVARAVYYGNYNYTDEYVKFNAYGNLETTDEFTIQDYLIDGVEEILDAFLEERSHIDITDDDFLEMVNKYLEESEEK